MMYEVASMVHFAAAYLLMGLKRPERSTGYSCRLQMLGIGGAFSRLIISILRCLVGYKLRHVITMTNLGKVVADESLESSGLLVCQCIREIGEH